MKRLLIFLLALWGTSSLLLAQKGLQVGPLFDGRYNASEKAVVSILKGKELDSYNLTLFHSITLTDSRNDVTRFEQAVLLDSKAATQIEMVNQKGQLRFCYFQLPPEGGKGKINRFVLFRKYSDTQATLIYMEGPTTLKSIIQLFVSKK
jgi:hypothetical protein